MSRARRSGIEKMKIIGIIFIIFVLGIGIALDANSAAPKPKQQTPPALSAGEAKPFNPKTNTINDKRVNEFYQKKDERGVLYAVTTEGLWKEKYDKEYTFVSANSADFVKDAVKVRMESLGGEKAPQSTPPTSQSAGTASGEKILKEYSGYINPETGKKEFIEAKKEESAIKIYVTAGERTRIYSFPESMEDAVKNMDWKEFAKSYSDNPNANTLPQTNKHIVTIERDNGGEIMRITDYYKDPKTNAETRLTTEIPASGTGIKEVKTSTTTKDGKNTKEITTTIYSDDTKRIVEGPASDPKSVVYVVRSTEGKEMRMQVSPEAYKENQNKFDDPDMGRMIIKAASDAGMTRIELKNGVMSQGDSQVRTIANLRNVVSTKNNMVVSESSSSGGIISYRYYENTRCADSECNGFIYQDDAKIITNEGGKLRRVEVQPRKDYWIDYQYLEGNEVEIGRKGSRSANPVIIGWLSLTPEENKESKVYGMYKFTTDKGEAYLEPSYSIGGALGTNWVDANGNKLPKDEIARLELDDPAIAERAINEKRKRDGQPTLAEEGSQKFFETAGKVLEGAQGFGYYAPLFLSDSTLLKWRDKVDQLFAKAYLGTEYWASAICGTYLDGEQKGIAYAETPQGFAQVGAHVEGTRTPPIEGDAGRQFVYKITFNIRNGDFDKDPRAPEEMEFNVVLKGERDAVVFKENQKVKRGDSFGKTGKSAIVQDSPIFYNRVCLVFNSKPLRWKLDNNELCNTIQESGGQPSSASPTGTTSTPSGKPSDEINDF